MEDDFIQIGRKYRNKCNTFIVEVISVSELVNYDGTLLPAVTYRLCDGQLRTEELMTFVHNFIQDKVEKDDRVVAVCMGKIIKNYIAQSPNKDGGIQIISYKDDYQQPLEINPQPLFSGFVRIIDGVDPELAYLKDSVEYYLVTPRLYTYIKRKETKDKCVSELMKIIKFINSIDAFEEDFNTKISMLKKDIETIKSHLNIE